MFESFFVPQIKFMGVDLSDRSVKLARLGWRGKARELIGLFEAEVPLGLLVEGRVKNRDSLIAHLKEVFASPQAKGLIAPYVAVALPDEQCFVRVLQLPVMPEKEMAQAIPYELEGLVPVDLKEARIDWHIIGRQPQQTKEVAHADVLVAATPNEVIKEYSDLFSALGFTVVALEPESVVLTRAILKEGLSYPPLLAVDVGGVHTGVMIASGTTLRTSASIQISARAFTERISRELKIPFREAEKRKHEFGILPTKEGRQNLEATIPLLTDFSEQLKGYLEFYRTHAFHEHELYTLTVRTGSAPGTFNFRPVSQSEVTVGRAIGGKANITKVVLTGGGADLKGFAEYLSNSLSLPVEIGDSYINLARVPDALREHVESTRFSTAIGISLHNIMTSLRVL
ncbi:MAG: hypothetical protein A2806_04700 [Candidatus Terrybacteria bacterium RIFCSPHIGHO2_01_FULL_48_17]|uniref:SHS2 domain-containing protein n=1 Tax=Candidatus Terrybacteria bacterium RIFCSPHIGHO2_01_FULL_48_17 TaxID=1802362 RepID=A0A1G2PKW6_9BACT|nr:MAG: hypothetical protein A2806_04700 [Candidatus Terrybacteria bacterium RIFCSPHIGHO2_01_FULL_48_17]OHA52094.1 MAG: hypothetical protein A3A30_04285 [Candidatus Terrybacteria bacterium RIFCSPLOWO2_01_FULL_48_14]